MSITDEISFGNAPGSREPLWRRLFLSLAIILVALASFGLGMLGSRSETEPIKLEYDPSLVSRAGEGSKVKNGAAVYASSGGKRYYYPNCAGLSRISEKNKLTFESSAAAEAAGYTLASGCSPR